MQCKTVSLNGNLSIFILASVQNLGQPVVPTSDHHSTVSFHFSNAAENEAPLVSRLVCQNSDRKILFQGRKIFRVYFFGENFLANFCGFIAVSVVTLCTKNPPLQRIITLQSREVECMILALNILVSKTVKAIVPLIFCCQASSKTIWFNRKCHYRTRDHHFGRPTVCQLSRSRS